VKHQKSTAERKIQLQVGECEVSTIHHISAIHSTFPSCWYSI